MLLKMICVIFVINAFISITKAIEISELNETRIFLSINSQLSELRSEQERQGKLMDGLVKDSDKYNLRSYPRSCAEVKKSGISDILLPNYSNQPFKVTCDAETHEGGWTIILRRMDGSVDFHRSWNIYKKGFGDLDGEFFLGLEKIHALTAERSQELLVLLGDYQGNSSYEAYEKFAIGGEEELFALRTLGKASGDAGDSLRKHHGMQFSTYDRDNDREPNKHCAEFYTAAWWYRGCHDSNLAGVYNTNTTGRGINWRSFRGVEYSLKSAVMLIRPRK
ncbi:ficolin-1-like [Drosophila innubila]|uniref:ficolin-1-like n=1 Tax=Drosophila innubila TaxID=198719 RepID=UPI00148D18BD|nr:ficolin-1-like [Drosophila innubila]